MVKNESKRLLRIHVRPKKTTVNTFTMIKKINKLEIKIFDFFLSKNSKKY